MANVCLDAHDHGLVGFWKLAGDCQDYSGFGNHGINHGAEFIALDIDGRSATVASFDGNDSYIEVPNSNSLSLGTSCFTISAWINCSSATDIIGDVLSKYDPALRKGFNFSIIDNQYRHQSNRRNVFFGIDDAIVEQWVDCGNVASPGKVGVWSLCVHKGKLYAGSYTRNNGAYSTQNPQGRVYRYEGGTRWTDCGSLGNSSSVQCLASYNGSLYAGVAYAESKEPNNFVGKVFCLNEERGEWIDCGEVGKSMRIECMAVFSGKLYVGTYGAEFRNAQDGVYCHKADQSWECVCKWENIISLGVYNNHLYATRARIKRYMGGMEWFDCGLPGGESNRQSWSLGVYKGKLHVGTFPSGCVFRCEDRKNWLDCGKLSEFDGEVMALVTYNGNLYGSLWPTGQVCRYDENNTWVCMGKLGKEGEGSSIKWQKNENGLWTSGVEGEIPPRWQKCYAGAPRVSRTPALAVYQGKLFAGTWNWEFDLPGHVYCMEAGKSVTYDHELGSGWKHLTLIKDTSVLKLYLNGCLVASSSPYDPGKYDISNDEPLRIGFGSYDYFTGKICQLRIYKRTLTDEEVKKLAYMY